LETYGRNMIRDRSRASWYTVFTEGGRRGTYA
jgi:hypothetical protein